MPSENLFDVMSVRESLGIICLPKGLATNKQACMRLAESLITNLVLCSKFEKRPFGNHLFTLIVIKKILNRSKHTQLEGVIERFATPL